MNSRFTTRKEAMCVPLRTGDINGYRGHARPKHEAHRSFVGCEQQVDNQHVEV